jgi:acyl-CoA synthetase (AMP-forming)/AMP-acid ligase II
VSTSCFLYELLSYQLGLQIPKSPTGKVLRRVLVERYEKKGEGKKLKAKL